MRDYEMRLTTGSREARNLRVGNDRLFRNGFCQVTKSRAADDAHRRRFLDLCHFPDDFTEPHEVVVVAGAEINLLDLLRNNVKVVSVRPCMDLLNGLVHRVIVVLVDQPIQFAVCLLAAARAALWLLHGISVSDVSVLHGVCGRTLNMLF